MRFPKTFFSLFAVMFVGAIAFGAWYGYASLGPYVLICALAESVGFKGANHGLVNLGTDQEFVVGLVIWLVAVALVSWLAKTVTNRPRSPK